MNKYNLFDDLTNVKYSKEFKKIKEFLSENHDYSKLSEVMIEENKAVIIKKDLSKVKEHIIESHLAYLDVHVMIQGSEKIYYDNVANVELKTAYDKDSDCYLYKGTLANDVTLNVNDVVVFTPIDVHSPLYQVKEANIIKIVFKFKI